MDQRGRTLLPAAAFAAPLNTQMENIARSAPFRQGSFNEPLCFTGVAAFSPSSFGITASAGAREQDTHPGVDSSLGPEIQMEESHLLCVRPGHLADQLGPAHVHGAVHFTGLRRKLSLRISTIRVV